MSENSINFNVGFGWLAITILIIAFNSEPDLVDAMIHWLMK